MKQGTVKFFKNGTGPGNGFGFITNDQTGKDIFVHITGLSPNTTLNEGDKVTYEEADGKKGKNAVNVCVVEHA